MVCIDIFHLQEMNRGSSAPPNKCSNKKTMDLKFIVPVIASILLGAAFSDHARVRESTTSYGDGLDERSNFKA